MRKGHGRQPTDVKSVSEADPATWVFPSFHFEHCGELAPLMKDLVDLESVKALVRERVARIDDQPKGPRAAAHDAVQKKESAMNEAQRAKFSEYDFIIAVDKSGSMGETDMPGNVSRYKAMQETVIALARDICEVDSDGIGLVLFSGAGVVAQDGCNVDKVKELFESNRPSGGTPLHSALEAAFKMAGKSEKKDFVIVCTDGVPDDRAAAAEVIRKQTHKQESDEACTVLFIQVGRDAAATSFLKTLDDDIKGAKFDIVDVKTIDEVDKFASVGELIEAAIAG